MRGLGAEETARCEALGIWWATILDALTELGDMASSVTYPAVSTAIKRSVFAEPSSVVPLTRDYGGQDGATSSNECFKTRPRSEAPTGEGRCIQLS
jgi:hypothetical protein